MGNSVKAANYKVIASCLRWRFSNSSTGNKTTSQCIPVLPTRHHAPKPAAPKNVVIGHSQPCHLQFIPSKPSAHGYDDMNPAIGNKFIDVTSAKRETGKALPPSRPNKHFQHVLAFWCLLLTLHSACATPRVFWAVMVAAILGALLTKGMKFAWLMQRMFVALWNYRYWASALPGLAFPPTTM